MGGRACAPLEVTVNVVLLTVGFFAIAMMAMATGVILSDRRLRGSCGGVGGDDCLCEIEKRRACHAKKQADLRLNARDLTMPAASSALFAPEAAPHDGGA